MSSPTLLGDDAGDDDAQKMGSVAADTEFRFIVEFPTDEAQTPSHRSWMWWTWNLTTVTPMHSLCQKLFLAARSMGLAACFHNRRLCHLFQLPASSDDSKIGSNQHGRYMPCDDGGQGISKSEGHVYLLFPTEKEVNEEKARRRNMQLGKPHELSNWLHELEVASFRRPPWFKNAINHLERPIIAEVRGSLSQFNETGERTWSLYLREGDTEVESIHMFIQSMAFVCPTFQNAYWKALVTKFAQTPSSSSPLPPTVISEQVPSVSSVSTSTSTSASASSVSVPASASASTYEPTSVSASAVTEASVSVSMSPLPLSDKIRAVSVCLPGGQSFSMQYQITPVVAVDGEQFVDTGDISKFLNNAHNNRSELTQSFPAQYTVSWWPHPTVFENSEAQWKQKLSTSQDNLLRKCLSTYAHIHRFPELISTISQIASRVAPSKWLDTFWLAAFHVSFFIRQFCPQPFLDMTNFYDVLCQRPLIYRLPARVSMWEFVGAARERRFAEVFNPLRVHREASISDDVTTMVRHGITHSRSSVAYTRPFVLYQMIHCGSEIQAARMVWDFLHSNAPKQDALASSSSDSLTQHVDTELQTLLLWKVFHTHSYPANGIGSIVKLTGYPDGVGADQSFVFLHQFTVQSHFTKLRRFERAILHAMTLLCMHGR